MDVRDHERKKKLLSANNFLSLLTVFPYSGGDTNCLCEKDKPLTQEENSIRW